MAELVVKAVQDVVAVIALGLEGATGESDSTDSRASIAVVGLTFGRCFGAVRQSLQR